MSDQTVLHALGSHSTRLLEAVVQSRDFASTLMALLDRLRDECRKRQSAGVRIGRPTMTENRISAHIEYYSLSMSAIKPEPEGRRLGDMLLKENAINWQFARNNPDVFAWLAEAVHLADEYGKAKGKKLGEVSFIGNMGYDGKVIVLEIQSVE